MAHLLGVSVQGGLLFEENGVLCLSAPSALLCSVWGVGTETAHFASSTAPFQALSRVGVLEGGCKAGEVTQFFCSLCLTSHGQFESLPHRLTGSSSYGCLPFAVFPHAQDRCHGSPQKHSTGCWCPLLGDPDPSWGSSSPLPELRNLSLFSLFPNLSVVAAFCIMTFGNLCVPSLCHQCLVVNFSVKFSVKIVGHGFCPDQTQTDPSTSISIYYDIKITVISLE